MEDGRVVTYLRWLNRGGQACSSPIGAKPKLLDQLHEALRSRHYSCRAVTKAGLTKRAACPIFRHSSATHPLESGYEI